MIPLVEILSKEVPLCQAHWIGALATVPQGSPPKVCRGKGRAIEVAAAQFPWTGRSHACAFESESASGGARSEGVLGRYP